MNEQQLLRSPDISPTDTVIAQSLSAANAAYVEFTTGIKSHDIALEWRYYKDGAAWLGKGLYQWTGARGGQKEVTVFWLSIWDGFFKITLFIPEKARADALNLPLSHNVKTKIAESTPMGKLKFFPLVFDISSNELFAEIDTLINFRKTLK